MFANDAVVLGGEAELAVRDYGGTGRHVVLIHGLSSNLAIWDPVAARLVPRLRVVAYDQRSHGLSTDGDGDFGYDALVRDLGAVIEARGLREPVIVGHSWGASVALEYAATQPRCPGVVCVDGGVFDMQAMGSTWEQTEQRLRPPTLVGPADEVIERIRSEQSFLPWDDLEPVVRRSRVATPDGLSRPRLELDNHMKIVRQLWEQKTWDVYERVGCGVLLVLARGVGRNPREQGFVAAKQAAADQLAARHEHVRVEWLESVHDIPLASPDELTRLVEEFVTSARE